AMLFVDHDPRRNVADALMHLVPEGCHFGAALFASALSVRNMGRGHLAFEMIGEPGSARMFALLGLCFGLFRAAVILERGIRLDLGDLRNCRVRRFFAGPESQRKLIEFLLAELFTASP